MRQACACRRQVLGSEHDRPRRSQQDAIRRSVPALHHRVRLGLGLDPHAAGCPNAKPSDHCTARGPGSLRRARDAREVDPKHRRHSVRGRRGAFCTWPPTRGFRPPTGHSRSRSAPWNPPDAKGRRSDERPEAWPARLVLASPSSRIPQYKSTLFRAHRRPLVPMQQSLSELTAPVFGDGAISELDNDLTLNAVQDGKPIGERIVVAGRVLDEGGRPVPGVLVEIWQANAAGRYAHLSDGHDAPLDRKFPRRGPDADPSRRKLSVRHDPAGRIPMAQSQQRLETCAHPFLRFRVGVHSEAGDANVLPRGSTPQPRSDPRIRARPCRPEEARVELLSRFDSSRSGPSDSNSTSCCEDRGPRPWSV